MLKQNLSYFIDGNDSYYRLGTEAYLYELPYEEMVFIKFANPLYNDGEFKYEIKSINSLKNNRIETNNETKDVSHELGFIGTEGTIFIRGNRICVFAICLKEKIDDIIEVVKNEYKEMILDDLTAKENHRIICEKFLKGN